MIIWSNTARAHLLHLDEYLSERSTDAAQRMAYRIYSTVGTLEQFPFVGRLGRIPGTRELVVPATPYVVMYRIADKAIEILAVLDGAQRWPRSFITSI
jgi:toxin ParE1/3/4